MHNSLHDHIQATSEPTPKQDGKAKQVEDKPTQDSKPKARKTLQMARIGNCPCPANLDKKPPVVHVHPSNGVFIAVDGDTVYISCTECSFEKDR